MIEVHPSSRLALVLAIVRSYKSTHRYSEGRRYETDELVNNLYVCIDSYIKQNPTADDAQLKQYGRECCHRFVTKGEYDRPLLQGLERMQEEQNPYTGITDKEKLLSIWGEYRDYREGKKPFTRLIGYLHYVEGMTIDELAELFTKHPVAIAGCIRQISIPCRKMAFKQNDIVLLVMDNPFFHGMLAWVKEPTEWGAIVEVERHCYPERIKWELRALDSEMMYIGTVKEIPIIPKYTPVDGGKHVVSNTQAIHKPETIYKHTHMVDLNNPTLDTPLPASWNEKNNLVVHTPTGDLVIPNGLHDPNVYLLQECPSCGQMKLRHNGPCLLCDACGATTGCG